MSSFSKNPFVFFSGSRDKKPFSYCDVYIPGRGWGAPVKIYLLCNADRISSLLLFSLVFAHFIGFSKESDWFLAETREKDTCLHIGHSSSEGESHPEETHEMVAYASLRRDC